MWNDRCNLRLKKLIKMKKILTFLFLIFIANTLFAQNIAAKKETDARNLILGNFMDDYEIRYSN